MDRSDKRLGAHEDFLEEDLHRNDSRLTVEFSESVSLGSTSSSGSRHIQMKEATSRQQQVRIFFFFFFFFFLSFCFVTNPIVFFSYLESLVVNYLIKLLRLVHILNIQQHNLLQIFVQQLNIFIL